MDRFLTASFGQFSFDRERLLLLRDGQPVAIGGRGAAILAALTDARGQVVTRAELLDIVWPGLNVEERNLTVQIANLRKAMGDLPDSLDPIRTVPRVGYRLLCEPPEPCAGSIAAFRPKVAVLPFDNLSGDPDLAFFADGITDDVIAALSRFRTLAVIARGSAFACRNRVVPAPEIARTLGVRYVLDGSVRRDGRRVRIAACLSDAEAGIVLWADRFEEELAGVFELQDRITAEVACIAEPSITRAEVERSRRRHPENLDAYGHFLLGRALVGHHDLQAGGYDAMVHHLDRATLLDPGFPQATAYAGLAHEFRRSYGGVSEVDDFAIAAGLCDRALASGGDDPVVLAIAGFERHNIRGDDAEGLALTGRALALNPHSYVVVDLAATIHLQLHNPDLAIALFERCLRLSPLPPQSSVTWDAIAACHIDAGRFAQAVEAGVRAVALGVANDTALVTLAVAQAMDGRLDASRATMERFRAIRPHVTIRRLLDRLAPGTRNNVERLWTEGLRLAGLPDG